jgi:hypothetical protein
LKISLHFSMRGRKIEGSSGIGIDTVLFMCYIMRSYANNVNKY